MRVEVCLAATVLLAVSVIASPSAMSVELMATTVMQRTNKTAGAALQKDSLCEKNENIIFTCRVKSSAKVTPTRPAKIISICGSRDLDREHGYLQYRFGLPGRIELEFPKFREGTQEMFRYTHYFRYQVDLTEINFNIDGHEYSVFDDYNGEEKPAISLQGVSVTVPGKPKDVMLKCGAKQKGDYSTLADVLNREQD